MSTEPEQKSVTDVVALLRKQHVAMMTTLDQGAMVSRPMGVQRIDDDATVWFFALADSDKAHQLEADPRTNLAFTDGDQLSVSGTAVIVKDQAVIDELWDKGVETWMQCEPTDPKVALIRVDADSVGYWDTPNAAGTLLEVAKGVLGGHRPQAGESGVVEV